MKERESTYACLLSFKHSSLVDYRLGHWEVGTFWLRNDILRICENIGGRLIICVSALLFLFLYTTLAAYLMQCGLVALDDSSFLTFIYSALLAERRFDRSAVAAYYALPKGD